MQFQKSKCALVTGAGAADGIGFAIAKALCTQGISVAITSTTARVHDRVAELRALGFKAQACIADLTQAQAVDALAAQVGAIDILVNNAGMTSIAEPLAQRRFLEMTEAQWDRSVQVNLKSAFLVTRALLPAMVQQKHGRVVNIASVTGPYVANEGESAYCAGKAGMVGLTHALALEMARDGITVNAIAPGWIDTGSSSAEEKRAGKNAPPGRAGLPDEVAAAAVFLASDGASYVNGAVLVVDGGNILQERKA